MASRIPLRVAGPTGRYRRSLRRFCWTVTRSCRAGGWCNARVEIGEVSEPDPAVGDNWPHDDPRWPTVCDRCREPFPADDQWQRADDPVLRLPDGTEFVFRGSDTAPVGTMIRAAWWDRYNTHPDRTEPWMVILPDRGVWITCQRASDGGYWTVTGTAPNLTVTPSIFHSPPRGWHGSIRDGYLIS